MYVNAGEFGMTVLTVFMAFYGTDKTTFIHRSVTSASGVFSDLCVSEGSHSSWWQSLEVESQRMDLKCLPLKCLARCL